MPFTATQFKVLYPQFATLSDVQIDQAYDGASITFSYAPNVTDGSDRQVTYVWNLITAHILTITNIGGSNTNNPSSTFVGRISNATEGSVSVASEYALSASGSYWSQSQYGVMFYEMMRANGGFNYIPEDNYGGWWW